MDARAHTGTHGHTGTHTGALTPGVEAVQQLDHAGVLQFLCVRMSAYV
jgi:hypothetical protein